MKELRQEIERVEKNVKHYEKLYKELKDDVCKEMIRQTKQSCEDYLKGLKTAYEMIER